MKAFVVLAILVLTGPPLLAERPNILWLTSEDHGPHMGCYGDPVARTPNIDALASKGLIFKRAWSVAPVCAPARAAIISGLYPSSSGAIHMRSMITMPAGTRMAPQFLREAGYYCINNDKTDYNLRQPGVVWDESSKRATWKNRGEGQPFFAVFNSNKSHEGRIRGQPHRAMIRPEEVRVPAYHPDTPEVRRDWARYHDGVAAADAEAGRRLRELAEAGLAADTIVFYFSDHGSGMPRSKRWPGNSGLHVPFVVYFPEKWRHLAPEEYRPGAVSDRLISFVDLAPTLLSLAGIRPPEWLQGHAFAGHHRAARPAFLFGERGRMDERVDLARSVTDGRYMYLRNYHPHVSAGQHVAYQFETPATRVWHERFLAGETDDAQSAFWRVPKPHEELYDLESDPDEVVNLAGSPDHRAILEKFRAAHRAHLLRIRDVTFLPEPEMHRRAGDRSPYDLARAPGEYPFDRILGAAQLASAADPADAPRLVSLMADEDGAVRFWAALGLLVRGEAAVAQATDPLKAALGDPSSDVRIVAAQALCLHDDDDPSEALATLGELASPRDHGVLTAMSALAAIESLGPKAAPLRETLAGLDPAGPSPDPVYDSYVPRLLRSLAASLDDSGIGE